MRNLITDFTVEVLIFSPLVFDSVYISHPLSFTFDSVLFHLCMSLWFVSGSCVTVEFYSFDLVRKCVSYVACIMLILFVVSRFNGISRPYLILCMSLPVQRPNLLESYIPCMTRILSVMCIPFSVVRICRPFAYPLVDSLVD